MLRRLLAALLGAAVTGLLLIASWPQLFGLHRTLVFAELVALRGLIVLLAILVAVVTVLVAILSTRSRPVAVLLTLALIAVMGINLAVLSTRGADREPLGAAESDEVTVLAWNTLGAEASANAVATLALESGAEIIALPETDRVTAEEVARIMADAGRTMQTLVYAPDENATWFATSLLIDLSLGVYAIDESLGSTPRMPSAAARRVDGRGPLIVAAHPIAPIPSAMAGWAAGLDWLAELCREDDVIIAGDFNATLDHFEGLRDAGADLGACQDAARVTGGAAIGTWPTGVPALLGAPIDHVVASSSWTFTGFQVLEARPDNGSDHRPVIARLIRST